MQTPANDLVELEANTGMVDDSAPIDFRAQQSEQEVEGRLVEMGMSVADTEIRDLQDDQSLDAH